MALNEVDFDQMTEAGVDIDMLLKGVFAVHMMIDIAETFSMNIEQSLKSLGKYRHEQKAEIEKMKNSAVRLRKQFLCRLSEESQINFGENTDLLMNQIEKTLGIKWSEICPKKQYDLITEK